MDVEKVPAHFEALERFSYHHEMLKLDYPRERLQVKIEIKKPSFQTEKRNMTKRIKLAICQVSNANGLSLIEVIVSAAILAIIALSVARMYAMATIESAKLVNISGIEIFRQKLVQAIQDDRSWRRTVFENRNGNPATSMRCLYLLGGFCPVRAFDPVNNPGFAVYNASGIDDTTYYSGMTAGSIYDSRNANMGFTLAGNKCVGFNAAAPSPNCPLRYNLKWFTNTATTSPLVYIYANLQVSPNTITVPSANAHTIGIMQFVGNDPVLLIQPLVRPSL